MDDRSVGDEGKASADELYAPFLAQLPVTGASIAVFDVHGRQSTICASDSTAARLEELQFDLGEGPHWLALSTGKPVSITDVADNSHSQWPFFGEAISPLGIGAIFAFPMVLGAVTVGVVDLYRSLPGSMSQKDYVLAIALCGQIAKRAVNEAILGAARAEAEPSAPSMRREVHQATGVVLVQLGVTATEAFFILRAHAFSSGHTVLSVSHEVLAGRLDFRDLPD